MTTTDALPVGVHYDYDEDAYHADPALSQSGMKTLLELPARFAYEREHPPQPTKAMNFGTVVHELVLHAGNRIVEVDAKDWRTKAAQAARDEAYEAGKAPVLTHELDAAREAAEAVTAHPIAGPLFTGAGFSEVTLRWDDPATGVPLRGRIDRIVTDDAGRWWPVDLKTTRDASPRAFGEDAWRRRYGLQSNTYCAGLEVLAEAGHVPAQVETSEGMLFVAVETVAPYLVSVGRLSRAHLDAGREDHALACDAWTRCSRDGVWPGYPDEVVTYPTPRWV